MSAYVRPEMLEFYERAKSYATNAIQAGVDWEDFREAVMLGVVDAAMEMAGNNKTLAAKLLNMDRNHLHRFTSNKIAHKQQRTISKERNI